MPEYRCCLRLRGGELHDVGLSEAEAWGRVTKHIDFNVRTSRGWRQIDSREVQDILPARRTYV